MKIKKLNIREAHDLYTLLEPVFPTIIPHEEPPLVDFLAELIRNIYEKDVSILSAMFDLFSKKKEDTINWDNQAEILSYLLHAFQVNRVVDLMYFFDGLTKNG